MGSMLPEEPAPGTTPAVRCNLSHIFPWKPVELPPAAPLVYEETPLQEFLDALKAMADKMPGQHNEELSIDSGNLRIKVPRRPGVHNARYRERLRQITRQTTMVRLPEGDPDWQKYGRYAPQGRGLLFIKQATWESLSHRAALAEFRAYRTIVVKPTTDTSILMTEWGFSGNTDFITPHPVEVQSTLPATEKTKIQSDAKSTRWQLSLGRFFKILSSARTSFPVIRLSRLARGAVLNGPAVPGIEKLASSRWAWDSTSHYFEDVDPPNNVLQWRELATAGAYRSFTQEPTGLDAGVQLRAGRMLIMQYAPDVLGNVDHGVLDVDVLDAPSQGFVLEAGDIMFSSGDVVHTDVALDHICIEGTNFYSSARAESAYHTMILHSMLGDRLCDYYAPKAIVCLFALTIWTGIVVRKTPAMQSLTWPGWAGFPKELEAPPNAHILSTPIAIASACLCIFDLHRLQRAALDAEEEGRLRKLYQDEGFQKLRTLASQWGGWLCKAIWRSEEHFKEWCIDHIQTSWRTRSKLELSRLKYELQTTGNAG